MSYRRAQFICLRSSTYHNERLIRPLLLSPNLRLRFALLHRQASSAPYPSPIEPAAAYHGAELALSETEQLNAKGLKVLKDALAKLRLKNRKLNAPTATKVDSKKSASLKHAVRNPTSRSSRAETLTQSRVMISRLPSLTCQPSDGTRTFQKLDIFNNIDIVPPVRHSDTYTPLNKFTSGDHGFQVLHGNHHGNAVSINSSGELWYVGKYISPSQELSGSAASPWFSDSLFKLNGPEQLDQEIQAFAQHFIPTSAEVKAKDEVASRVQKIINCVSQERLMSETFGSVRAGYALPASDIDIRIYLPEQKTLEATPSEPTRKLLVKSFSPIRNALRQNGFDVREAILHSRYPLLDLGHRESGIKVQIVCANDTHAATTYVCSNMARNPHVQSIYVIINIMLQIRNLTNVFQGGIGSYTLMIMVIASMKLRPGASVGESLINFLRFYSTLNTREENIGLVPPEIGSKQFCSVPPLRADATVLDHWIHAKMIMSQRNPTKPFLLTLQDPVDKNNDLGRKAFGWLHIAKTFKHLLSGLETAILLEPEARNLQAEPLLLPLIGGAEECFQSQRRKMEEFGTALLKEQEQGLAEWQPTLELDQKAEQQRQNWLDALLKSILDSEHPTEVEVEAKMGIGDDKDELELIESNGQLQVEEKPIGDLRQNVEQGTLL